MKNKGGTEEEEEEEVDEEILRKSCKPAGILNVSSHRSILIPWMACTKSKRITNLTFAFLFFFCLFVPF